MKALLTHKAGLLSLFCALLSLGAAGMMLWRNSQDLLWSYWTLIVLFFAWWAIFLWVKRKDFSQADQLGFLAKASLSGILLGFSFPFSHLPTGFLALIAWVPFFRMVETQVARGLRTSQIYFYAFHSFVLWNILATYWVANSSFPAGVFAITVNSALMGIPLLLHLGASRLMPRLKWIPFIAFWLCFEFMHFHWELNWPWLSLGNVWATAPELVQWYQFTGVLGGSLWILIVNSLSKDLWEIGLRKKRSFNYHFRLGIAVFLPLLLSLYQYQNYQEKGTPVDLAVVQPNVEPFYERPQLTQAAIRQKLIDLGQEVIQKETDYILYPEATLEFLDQNKLSEAPAIVGLRQGLLNGYPQTSLIIGADTYRFLKENEKPGRYTRSQNYNGQQAYFEIYNVALQVRADDSPVDLYKKSKLVPGAELFPYPGVFQFLKPLVEQLGGTMAGRGAQRERSNFKKDSLEVATAICYESVFGEHIAQHVQNGAQALFIITNDAWWDYTAGHLQHFHYARLRAIENRRAIARSANTGISGFINQRGDVISRSKYRETTSLSAQLLFSDQLTYYSRNTQVVARFALFAALTFILNWIARSLVPAKE